MTTLYDVINKCPLAYWTKEHRHCIHIELATGQSLVMRASMSDLRGYECTGKMLRHASPWLADKSDSVLDAISSLVDERFLLLAKDQLAIANHVTEIIKAIVAGDYLYARTTLVRTLAVILLKYEPHATLAGWVTWLETCVDYCKENQSKEKS